MRFAVRLAVRFALLCALAVLGPAEAAAAPARADRDADLQRFREALVALRDGDAAARQELLEAAQALCARHGRCDAVAVARHYAGLGPQELAAGRAAEARYLILRERVHAAREQGVLGEAWAEERALLCEELAGLADEVEPRADFVPAAQATALLARLLVQRLEDDAPAGAARAELAAEAERQALRADGLFERAGQRTPRLETRWLLARLALAGGARGEARARFERCLAEAGELGNDDFREHALEGLLVLALGAGDAAEQQRLLEQLATFRDPRTCWPLASGWAAWLLHSDHAEQALDFLWRHPPASGAHPVEAAEWELLMGSTLLRLEDLEAARAHLERAVVEGGSEASILALADLALREDRAFEVEGLLGAADVQAGLSPLGLAEARRILGEARLSRGDLDAAAEELEGALELAARWGARFALDPLDGGGEGPRSLAEAAARGAIGEWVGLHAVALLAEVERQRGDGLAALWAMESAQSRTLRGAVGERTGELDAAHVEAWARHCELGLVSWVVGPDFSVAAWAGAAPGEPLEAAAARIGRGRSELFDAARRLREAALAGRATWLARERQRVRDALLPAPIAARLRAARSRHRGAEVPRLLLAVHGPLEATPLELLDLEELVGGELALLVLPGLPAPEPGAALAIAGPWRLLGAPLDGRGGALLPGAAGELEELARLLPGAQVRAGADFTRAALLAALATPGPLHVATHLHERCTAAPGGIATGALLASGGAQVCSAEIAAAGPALPLVVLSACTSGGGRFVDAEGLHGLGRAFLGAGTRNLLATSWPVEDAAARAFALAFHRALLAGASPSRAARTAREELRAAGAPPADWSAFRLLGRD